MIASPCDASSSAAKSGSPASVASWARVTWISAMSDGSSVSSSAASSRGPNAMPAVAASVPERSQSRARPVAIGAQRAGAPGERRRRSMVSAVGRLHRQRFEPVGDLVVGARGRFTEVDGRLVTVPVRLEGDRQRPVDPAAKLWCRRRHERVAHEWMREPDRHRVHLDQAGVLRRAPRRARVAADRRVDDRARALALERGDGQGKRRPIREGPARVAAMRRRRPR